MKSEVNEIALQGIEFWSTVCDEETDLAIEAAEAEEQGRPPEQVSRFYVRGALSFLIEVLLQSLTKQVGVALLLGGVALVLILVCREVVYDWRGESE